MCVVRYLFQVFNEKKRFDRLCCALSAIIWVNFNAGMSGWLLRTSFRSHRPSNTALSKSTSSHIAALPVEHVRVPFGPFRSLVLLHRTLYRIVSVIKHWFLTLIEFRLQNDLYCVGWGVKLYSLTDTYRKRLKMKLFAQFMTIHDYALGLYKFTIYIDIDNVNDKVRTCNPKFVATGQKGASGQIREI